ncbi:Kelch repeat-containing protein [Geothrix fermentans]|uniref:Kelch repeat-containing protein n=1 Tax=Geothrix fermentans TaxID=44676 RepID=UPI00069633B8|nr:kelch repeat-containing protein [Geothrix fermentans]
MSPVLVAAGLALLSACGGGSSSSGSVGAPPPPATLRLLPASGDIKVGGALQVWAEDAQGHAVQASFSVVEAQGGTVDAAGRYQAPATAGTYHLRATSSQAPGAVAEAAVKVSVYQVALAPAPSSQVSRLDHTASLLPDGSVLLAGGVESSQLERYLPSSGSFAPAGDLGTRRWAHQASALPGGGVLLTGGIGVTGNVSAVQSTAQIYEPGTGARPAGAMTATRMLHAAAELADGRVLLTGGLPVTGSDIYATATAEIFNPATGGFTASGSMGTPRTGHTATRLPDGKILIAGGRDSSCAIYCPLRIWASAELYDPATGTFTSTGRLTQARYGHTATALPDGRVLITGGTTPDLPDTDMSSSVEIYDPATGTFAGAGTLLRPRSHHTATLLTDGRILLAHGRTTGESSMASATLEVFDPLLSKSVLLVSNLTTRYSHTATRLLSGDVLLAGGTEGGGGINLTELFR